MTVDIIHRLPTPSEFKSLRAQTDWGIPDELTTETILKHSFSGVVAMMDGETIGIARTVGDGCLILYIQDVIIASPHRSHGVGRSLVKALLEEAAKTCLPSCTIGLFAATGQAEFYEKLGFSVRCNPAYGPGMHGTLSDLAKSSAAA